jgi:hypothetical protein
MHCENSEAVAMRSCNTIVLLEPSALPIPLPIQHCVVDMKTEKSQIKSVVACQSNGWLAHFHSHAEVLNPHSYDRASTRSVQFTVWANRYSGSGSLQKPRIQLLLCAFWNLYSTKLSQITTLQNCHDFSLIKSPLIPLSTCDTSFLYLQTKTKKRNKVATFWSLH